MPASSRCALLAVSLLMSLGVRDMCLQSKHWWLISPMTPEKTSSLSFLGRGELCSGTILRCNGRRRRVWSVVGVTASQLTNSRLGDVVNAR